MFRSVVFAVGMSLLWAAGVEAQVPSRIHYQGRLFSRLTGEPMNGPVRFRFRLWNGPGDGSTPGDEVLLWDEAHGFEDGEGSEPVLVESGFYEVELGSVSPIPAEIFSATSVYLEIQVENDAPMLPRQRIVTVPFAFQADLLDGKQGSEYLDRAGFVEHASNSSAHHTKTTDAAEIISGVFSEERIPLAIARHTDLIPFEDHLVDTNNPHQVTLEQAGAVTLHNSLIGAKGHLGHAAIDAHILGLVASATTPLYDHTCPNEMARVGASCMDRQLYRNPGETTPLSATWFEAARKCAIRGKRLCNNSEWYIGCKDTPDIKEIGTNEEWVDDWATYVTGSDLWPISRGSAVGLTSCESSVQVVNPSNPLRFRCCR